MLFFDPFKCTNLTYIVQRFSKDELNVATSYGTLIGKGGFGKVYLGIFHSLEVAVKVVDVSEVQCQLYENY